MVLEGGDEVLDRIVEFRQQILAGLTPLNTIATQNAAGAIKAVKAVKEA